MGLLPSSNVFMLWLYYNTAVNSVKSVGIGSSYFQDLFLHELLATGGEKLTVGWVGLDLLRSFGCLVVVVFLEERVADCSHLGLGFAGIVFVGLTIGLALVVGFRAWSLFVSGLGLLFELWLVIFSQLSVLWIRFCGISLLILIQDLLFLSLYFSLNLPPSLFFFL